MFDGEQFDDVAYLADEINHAPTVRPDGALTPDQELALFEYYGLGSALVPDPGLPPRAPVEPPRLVRHYSRAEAANVAAARQLAGEGERRDDRYPGSAAIDADRLAAVEERVAELESRRGR